MAGEKSQYSFSKSYFMFLPRILLSPQTKAKPEEAVKPMKEPDAKPQKDTGCSVS